MKFRKLTHLFGVLIICLSTFFVVSCKKGITEPGSAVLTTEIIEKLQAVADKVMIDKLTPGLIAYISVEGEKELYISRGVANLTTNEPMNTNNYFRIASVTKTFTTEAVLILAGEGKIDLNKKISFYLPEYALPGKDIITIRMLGNMTSGLIDYLSDSTLQTAYYGSQGTIKFTPEELIVPILTSKLNFTPGTQYEYCNTNIMLLGLVITKVTGQSVKDVLQEKIFQPLGLTHTFWPETNYIPSPYHHAYTNLLGVKDLDVTYYGNSWGNAAGILISNIADLKIWAKELYDRKLIPDNLKNERFLKGVPNSTYGFGLGIIPNMVGHSGGIVGYNTMVLRDGIKKLTIITHTNSFDDAPAEYAFKEFAKVLGY